MRVDVIIPSFRPQKRFFELIERLEQQTVQIGRIIVFNTQPEKEADPAWVPDLLREHPSVRFFRVSEAAFDHGGTRQAAAAESDAEFFICMTQDALPADDFLVERLTEALLGREDAAVAYARQLPEADASPIERFTRTFNYPQDDRVKTLADLPALGIKTFFCSNVCAAYRRSFFEQLGGFSSPTIFNEDMIYAARAVKAGHAVVYAAGARVIHSHNYSLRQLFSRNFDLGVSHAQYPEIFSDVPPEGEGAKLVKRTAVYLLKTHPFLLPLLCLQSAAKLTGYWLGKRYQRLPLFLTARLSFQKPYWEKERRP